MQTHLSHKALAETVPLQEAGGVFAFVQCSPSIKQTGRAESTQQHTRTKRVPFVRGGHYAATVAPSPVLQSHVHGEVDEHKQPRRKSLALDGWNNREAIPRCAVRGIQRVATLGVSARRLQVPSLRECRKQHATGAPRQTPRGLSRTITRNI